MRHQIFLGGKENINLGFPGASDQVKNMSAMQDIWAQYLGREDRLEKEMATHPSILAWEIPWTEEPDGLQSIGLQDSQTQLSDFHFQ